MKRRNFLLASAPVAASFLVSRTLGQKRPAGLQSPKLDGGLLLEVTKVPGIAIAGLLNGSSFQLLAGNRDASTPSEITGDTYFPAASLSKPVFAWAVVDLVQQGKLDWHRPLEDYGSLGLTGEARKITAEHCLTHSTGLANWRFQPDAPLVSQFPPGTRWQYSGEGIYLLQRVVERIAGEPIALFMKKALLGPMGMTASSYAWTPELLPKAAIGHDGSLRPHERSLTFYERRNYETLQKAGLIPETATYDQIISAYEQAKAAAIPIAMSPNMAGSLQTTITDYAKFLIRVSTEMSKRPENFRPRVEVNRQISWTLGWGVDRSQPAPAIWHWGDGPGFKNFAWVQPEKKTSLVFFTNGDRGAALYSWIFRKLLNNDSAAFYWI